MKIKDFLNQTKQLPDNSIAVIDGITFAVNSVNKPDDSPNQVVLRLTPEQAQDIISELQSRLDREREGILIHTYLYLNGEFADIPNWHRSRKNPES